MTSFNPEDEVLIWHWDDNDMVVVEPIGDRLANLGEVLDAQAAFLQECIDDIEDVAAVAGSDWIPDDGVIVVTDFWLVD